MAALKLQRIRAQAARRDEKGAGVHEQEVGYRHERHERAGEPGAEDLTGVVCRHDAGVGRDQFLLADQRGDGRELPAVEDDPERRLHEGHGIDVRDAQQPADRQDGDHGDHERLGDAAAQHETLAVEPVDDRAEQQTEQQVGHELRSGGQRQVRRRVSQLEHQ